MPTTTFILAAGAFAASLGVLGWREHRKLRSARRGLLANCESVLAGAHIIHGGDEFPKMTGRRGRDAVDVALIPDTMTIRRLPQLWLSVTVKTPVPADSGFAVLVRPSGNDFFSLTHTLETRLEPPPVLPWEVSIRGEDERAGILLERLAPVLSSVLADPRVKEIAITRNGCRIVRQAAEGRRGEHLLLRQAMFDNAEVSKAQLLAVLAEIDEILAAARSAKSKEAAAA